MQTSCILVCVRSYVDGMQEGCSIKKDKLKWASLTYFHRLRAKCNRKEGISGSRPQPHFSSQPFTLVGPMGEQKEPGILFPICLFLATGLWVSLPTSWGLCSFTEDTRGREPALPTWMTEWKVYVKTSQKVECSFTVVKRGSLVQEKKQALPNKAGFKSWLPHSYFLSYLKLHLFPKVISNGSNTMVAVWSWAM